MSSVYSKQNTRGAAESGACSAAPSCAFTLILIAGIALAMPVFSVLPGLSLVIVPVLAVVIIDLIAPKTYKVPKKRIHR